MLYGVLKNANISLLTEPLRCFFFLSVVKERVGVAPYEVVREKKRKEKKKTYMIHI
jgi:hypothetical protein